MGEIVAQTVGNEIATVLAQDFYDGLLRVPSERTPDDFVDVVVAAFRIAQETDRVRHLKMEDAGAILGPRIDRFPPFGQGISDVPVRNGELAFHAVSNVRIKADRKTFGKSLAQTGYIDPHLRPIDDPRKPGGLSSHKVKEFFHPRFVERLGRNPHLGLRVVAVQVAGLFFKQRHQIFRLGVARIASRNKHRINAG